MSVALESALDQNVKKINKALWHFFCGRHDDLMVSALNSGLSGPGSSLGGPLSKVPVVTGPEKLFLFAVFTFKI